MGVAAVRAQFPYVHSHCLANLLYVATEHTLVFSNVQYLFSGRENAPEFVKDL